VTSAIPPGIKTGNNSCPSIGVLIASLVTGSLRYLLLSYGDFDSLSSVQGKILFRCVAIIKQLRRPIRLIAEQFYSCTERPRHSIREDICFLLLENAFKVTFLLCVRKNDLISDPARHSVILRRWDPSCPLRTWPKTAGSGVVDRARHAPKCRRFEF
jgi:hypothetical protein